MNDSGYAIMAEEMLDAIRSRGYPRPSSNCAEMTIVPNP
jgi:hypothetical protein